jgi:hypothetical protein
MCPASIEIAQLTVFRPASVMAETARKSASMKGKLFSGLADPHSIKPPRSPEIIKYE